MTEAAANSNSDFRVTTPGLPGLKVTNPGKCRTGWLSARRTLQLGAGQIGSGELQAR